MIELLSIEPEQSYLKPSSPAGSWVAFSRVVIEAVREDVQKRRSMVIKNLVSLSSAQSTTRVVLQRLKHN